MIEYGMLEWQHILKQIQKNLDYENIILILVAFDKVWGHIKIIINHLMTIIFKNCFTLIIWVCLLLVPLLLSIIVFCNIFYFIFEKNKTIECKWPKK
jgi:hypothetical protein